MRKDIPMYLYGTEADHQRYSNYPERDELRIPKRLNHKAFSDAYEGVFNVDQPSKNIHRGCVSSMDQGGMTSILAQILIDPIKPQYGFAGRRMRPSDIVAILRTRDYTCCEPTGHPRRAGNRALLWNAEWAKRTVDYNVHASGFAQMDVYGPALLIEWAKSNPTNQEEETAMSENTNNVKYLNLAAILNNDITTLEATFEAPTKEAPGGYNGGKRYTYKVTKPLAAALKKGDVIVVEAKDTYSLAYVTEIHEEVQISPDSHVQYKWVVGLVDLVAIETLKKLEDLNAKRLLKEHTASIRKRTLESYGVQGVQLLTVLPEETK